MQPASRKLARYATKMTRLSGCPKTFTEIQKGKVRARAIPQKSHAAKNLPQTRVVMEIGVVTIWIIVFVLNSSAHSRIAIPGIKIRYSQGWKANIEYRFACPFPKKSPK